MSQIHIYEMVKSQHNAIKIEMMFVRVDKATENNSLLKIIDPGRLGGLVG